MASALKPSVFLFPCNSKSFFAKKTIFFSLSVEILRCVSCNGDGERNENKEERS